MTPLTSIELNTTQGGKLGFDVSEFFGGLVFVLGAACGITGHPAVCGAALVAGGTSLLF